MKKVPVQGGGGSVSVAMEEAVTEEALTEAVEVEKEEEEEKGGAVFSAYGS